MKSISRNGGLVERQLTKDEQFLKGLDYESDERIIWNLSSADFRKWLYGLDATDAVLLSGKYSFQLLCALKRNKWLFLWRMLWA